MQRSDFKTSKLLSGTCTKTTNVIPEIKDLDDEFNMSNLGPPPAIPRIDEFNAKFNGPFFGPNFEAKTDHPNLLCC